MNVHLYEIDSEYLVQTPVPAFKWDGTYQGLVDLNTWVFDHWCEHDSWVDIEFNEMTCRWMLFLARGGSYGTFNIVPGSYFVYLNNNTITVVTDPARLGLEERSGK